MLYKETNPGSKNLSICEYHNILKLINKKNI